ncbi:MAG TPA: hypothetical protein EYH54_01325 [Nautiliaceae bacterium]|nr:hypothetical protein [Nautiliaceae bacterium]
MLVFKRLELFYPRFFLSKDFKLIKNHQIVGNILYNEFIHLKKEYSEKTVLDILEFSLIDLLSELAYFDFDLVYEEPKYAQILFSKKIKEYFLRELINLEFIDDLSINQKEKEALKNKYKKKIDIKEFLDFYNSLKFSESKALSFYNYLKKEINEYFKGEKEFIFEIKENEKSKEFSIKSYLAFSLFYNLNLPKKTLLEFFDNLFLNKKEEIEKESEEFSFLVDNFYNLINYELSEKKKILEKRKKESLKILLNHNFDLAFLK